MHAQYTANMIVVMSGATWLGPAAAQSLDVLWMICFAVLPVYFAWRGRRETSCVTLEFA